MKGMLRAGERKLLYTLAAKEFRGDGHIVDAGAFAGASAFCFGAGLRENDRISSRLEVIHS